MCGKAVGRRCVSERESDPGVGMSEQPIITATIELALGVNVGSLIDFETTGVPGKHPEHEIVTLGSLVRDKLHIVQRKSRNKEPFYSEVRRIVRELPRPIYAYNTDFEKSIINVELGISAKDSEFVDLMKPWKEKASRSGIKWPKLEELISEPEDDFREKKITGRDVPVLWKEYIETGDDNLLDRIMSHCLSDMLREMVLLVRYIPRALEG